MRLIIAGSRNFNDYQYLSKMATNVIVDYISETEAFSGKQFEPGDAADYIYKHVTIISGTARGADQLGEKFAMEEGLSLEQYPAKWDIYGKSAGYRRNEQMAKTGTHLLAFWDGKSRGTKHMIDLAQYHGLKINVVRFKGE
jgi:hypothetical protein